MKSIIDIIQEELDKMSAIDIPAYYEKHKNNKELLQTLSTFPEGLQREIIDEMPNGNEFDIKNWKLLSPQPVSINTADALRTTLTEDKYLLSRLPQEVVNIINKNWGTNGKSETVYDSNPQRYFQYAKMPATSAKPSVMVNGVIEWGVGRFVAALIRGDKTIKVWNIKN